MNQTEIPRVITSDELLAVVQLGATTVHELTSAGLFPPAFQLGGRRVARLVPEVHAWLAARAKELDDAEMRRLVADMVAARPDAGYPDLRALIDRIIAARPQGATPGDAVARRRPDAAIAARAAKADA